MSEEKRNWLGPYVPEGSLLRELVQQGKLAYNLMLDGRVPALAKLIPIGALAYVLMPIDLAPDLMPVLGQLDDAAIVFFGLRLFFEFAPQDVVHEHLKRLAQTMRGTWSVTDEPPTPPAPGASGDVVEGSFRPEDDIPKS